MTVTKLGSETSSKRETKSGFDFQEKSLGQLAPKFSDLVTSKSISFESVTRESSVKKNWSHCNW